MPGLQKESQQKRWPQSLCSAALPDMLAKACETSQGCVAAQSRAGQNLAGSSRPVHAMHRTARACQSRKKQWRVQTVKRGRYSPPKKILLAKVTHHVGSSLHVPCKRGGRVTRTETATLALCQLLARQQATKIDPTGAWILIIGAAAVDPKCTAEYKHQPAVWRDEVAGRLLATAKIERMVEPQAAKAKFARHRADTGELQHFQSSLPQLAPCTHCLRHAGSKDRKRGVHMATAIYSPDTTENCESTSCLQSSVQRACTERGCPMSCLPCRCLPRALPGAAQSRHSASAAAKREADVHRLGHRQRVPGSQVCRKIIDELVREKCAQE